MPSLRNRRGGATALAVVLALALMGCGPGATTGSRLTITGAWVRASTPGATMTAAYLTITNDGDADDTLTGVTSPSAGSVGMHRTSTSTDTPSMPGMVGMDEVDAIHVPAGGTATLEPGGFHLMLSGLAGDLVAGSKVTLVLTFEHAGPVTVEAEVRTT